MNYECKILGIIYTKFYNHMIKFNERKIMSFKNMNIINIGT